MQVIAAGEDTVRYANPMVHDPVMAYENGTYHIFATGQGVQHLVSHDRKRWHVMRQPLMTVMPKWTHDTVPGFGQHVWAPDVMKWHGRWWMAYSCSTFGRNTSAIGLMSAPSLSSPVWDDQGCIIASRHHRDNWNAIDPNFIVDENDQPWMVFGSFWDGIQLVRLDSTLHVAQACKPVTIARRYALNAQSVPGNPTSRFAGSNAIEAPFVFRHGGYYYLFVSWDYCCRGMQSNYRVAVGRSKTVQGPYVDRQGRDMLLGGGTIVIQGDKKQYEAAGHCAVYSFEGQDVFICHGYSMAFGGASLLVQRQITWDKEGWPVLNP